MDSRRADDGGKPGRPVAPSSVCRSDAVTLTGPFTCIRMTAPQVEFLALVEEQTERQEYPSDWLPDAMKVIHLVPVEMQPDAAALVFCRWLFGKPPNLHDFMMREILTPDADETSGKD